MDNWVHITCANIHYSSSIDHISNFQITFPSPNDNDEKVASSPTTLPYLTTCSYLSCINLPIPFIKDKMWKKKHK